MRRRDGIRWAAGLAAYRLQFPADLDFSSVETFLAGLSGLRAPSWKRPFVVRGVVLEVCATESGIDHRILTDRRQHEVVVTHLRGALPSVGITLDPDYSPPIPTLAGDVEITSSQHQLRTDNPGAISSAILASLMPLGPGEALIAQYLLMPLGSRQPVASGRPWWLESLDPKKSDTRPTVPKSTQQKYAHPLFAVSLRLGVTAGSKARSRALLARLTGALHLSNSPEAHLRRRRISSKASRRQLMGRTPHLASWPCQLNSVELSGLVAWPGANVSLPGLRTGGTRQLAPASDIEREGRVLGDATFPGLSRPVALSVIDSLSHIWIQGGTGVGKTTVAINTSLQDMNSGYGVIYLDPKRDAAEDLLDRIPAHRRDDVIVLDPLDSRPVGLNILSGGGDNPELVAEELFGILSRINKASFVGGPRMADLLRTGLLSLALTPGAILPDLPRLYTDTAYRRQVVGALDDPVGLEAAWRSFDSVSEAEQNTMAAPILNKIRPLITRKKLRYIFGQQAPLLDFDELLATGRILIVPLSVGELGADAAAFLGAVITAMIFQAVMRRVRLPREQRRPVFVYIDEAQTLSALPTPLSQMLATARAMGISVTLLNQFLGQFDPELKEAVLSTARSRLTFQTTASDAARLAKDLAPHLSAQDLQSLGAYEAVATLVVGSRVAPPVTIRTRPAPPALGTAADVKERSRRRWGADRDEIEQALRQRHDQPSGTARISRQRRSS
jgi:DNA helicase HerA-like ATPase